MLEKEIVASILKLLRARPRCFAWKTHGGMYGTAGIPGYCRLRQRQVCGL